MSIRNDMSRLNHEDAAKVSSLVYKGISMLEKGRYYKAAVLFNKAMQISPIDEDIKNLLKKALRYLSKSEREKLFGDRIIHKKTKEKREVKLGERVNKIEEKLMEEEGAYVILRVEKPPFIGMDPNGPFNEGLKLLEQMELEKASRYFDSSIDDNPNNEILWNNMGVACMGLKYRNVALMWYGKALRINPTYYIGFYNVGAVYYECKQNQEAIKYFDEALKYNPNCAEAIQDRKLAYENMSDQELTQLGRNEHKKLREKVYSDSFNTKGLNFARAYMNANSALVDLGNGKDAILGNFKRVLKNSTQVKELFDKAQELIGKKKIKQSINYFDEALKLNPQDATIWIGKGFALSLLKNIEEALKCFEEGTKLDPNHELAWLFKGATLGIQKKFEEAIACYQQVLRINPFNEEAKLGKEALKK